MQNGQRIPCVVIEEDSTTQSVLDYRFGWRWLLPSSSGQQAVYFGLNHEEQRWWIQTLAMQSLQGVSSPTEGCLIALDHCDLRSVVNMVNVMCPSWLCAWGSGSAISLLRESLGGFGSVREYALLPADSPRVVVPLSSSSKHAIAGLRLHRPGRWIAQFGLLAACGLAKFGYFGLVRRRVLLVATRSSDCPVGAVHAKLSIALQSEQQDYALYLGVQGDKRKTVVLPMKNSQLKVILKTAESIKAREALKNEAQALQTLATITSLASRVPKLIGIEETDCSLTLLQEYHSRQFVRKYHFNAAVVDFLVELARLERKEIKLEKLLSLLPRPVCMDLSARVNTAATRLKEKLANLAENGFCCWTHRCHGDFASWNCTWSGKGLFVFDWEDSQANDLALGDAFYFILSPFVHVQKQPDATFAMTLAIQFAEELAERVGFDEIDVRMYLAIWLLQRLSQHPFYGKLVVELEQSWQ